MEETKRDVSGGRAHSRGEPTAGSTAAGSTARLRSPQGECTAQPGSRMGLRQRRQGARG